MTALFEQTSLQTMTLRNRLVRSATWEGMCDRDGRPTEKLSDFYRDLAAGGVGLIVTGFTFVRPDGKQMPGKMGIHTDAFEPEMRALAEGVHGEGGRICLQLVHAGGQTDTRNAGRQPLAPSAVQVAQFPEMPAELRRDEIEAIISAFGEGARRAKEWGFDAVQLHGAHGYLINQFLSPLTNLRTDEYGGSIEKRCRFLLEVYDKVRATVGADYPVLIKLNGSDNLSGGLSAEDALYAARKLSERGIDAIEVSGGTSASGEMSPVRAKIDSPAKEAYNFDLALKIKKGVACPVMVVGGFRSLEVVEQVIVEEGLDYVAMARPFIREPGLANRWLSGDQTPARCISCNGCFAPGIKEGGIYCVIEKKEQVRVSTK
ncbi:MAG: NADH:flavin oxidoreductase [Proteobacteria bacterium]|nr:NADH:flavin oxidoreductase [Pseudomonadota bacterium]MBU1687255.1 NADH:flavin oxidoreductase [Pseudomonadota bacterium]